MADLDTIELVKDIEVDKYKYGFTTDIESDYAPKGLNEDIVKFISDKKGEPHGCSNGALKPIAAGCRWMSPPGRACAFPKIDFQDLYYYAAPKSMATPKSLDEIDPKLLETYAKLGIPLKEQEILAGVRKQGEKSMLDDEGNEVIAGRVAIDAVFDSVSVVTTFKAELAKAGVIFCSISEALREHPELVRKYLGSVVPQGDNFYAALNAAVFSDGSFVYVPPNTRCPMELSTYFRMNAKNTGQFERTLIIADKGSYVSYLEGCTAPMREESQLHAAVVELIALDDAEIKYSTVQNWYPGDAEGKGGVYNFVTKRGDCRGRGSKISWTQVETGSAITWKYPSCILRGDNSRGEFYSIAISNGRQQVDSGTKMIHLGQEHLEPHHLQGHCRWPQRQYLSRPGLGPSQGHQCPQLHPVRLAADRRQVRRPHGALYRGEDLNRAVRARGHDVENLRRPDVLLHVAGPHPGRSGGPHRQRLRARRAAAIAHGIHGGNAEADRD